MKKYFTLSIPEPCHKNWNTMTSNKQGRHCDACSKTVVDFTRKTDLEIAKLVKSGDSLCGRFKKDQLGRPITLPRKRDAFFEIIPPSYAASLLIPVAILGTQQVKAQETNSALTEQTMTSTNLHTGNQERLQGEIAITPDSSKAGTLKGNISDENGPLPGAHIRIKGTPRTTKTDFDGNYKIQAAQGETIVISFIGYSSQELLVTKLMNKRVDTVLHYDDELMGDIIIVGKLRQSPNLKSTLKN